MFLLCRDAGKEVVEKRVPRLMEEYVKKLFHGKVHVGAQSDLSVTLKVLKV